MQTLLKRTGFGLSTCASHFAKLSPSYVKGLLMDKGFLVVRGNDLTEPQIIDLVKTYGAMVNHDESKNVGSGYKDLFKLDGEKDKIVNGTRQLPLHADGGLVQTRVDHVYLYASRIENMRYQGATIVTDHKLAVEEMPPHMRRVLEEEQFEYMVFDRDYYAGGSPPSWFTVPVFVDHGWTRRFYCYFNFPPDFVKPGWQTRIKGFTQAETDRFLAELLEYLKQPRYCYWHYWNQGDFLILDNRRTIHGREPFDENAKRVIFRLQTVDPSSSEKVEIRKNIN